MSERRTTRIPLQRARRIHVENQARGQRARVHLERARGRQRETLLRTARSRRRGDAPQQVWAGRRRILAMTLFALSLAAGLTWAWPALDLARTWGSDSPLRIERVAVQGNRVLSSREVAAATGVRPGEEGLAVDPEAVRARLRAHPWIRDAQVMRLPTGKLLVSIDERRPVAVLAPVGDGAQDPTTWRFVDESGTPFALVVDGGAETVALEDADGRPWPRLRGGETLEDGQAHPELAAGLALARHLRASALPELLSAPDQVELYLPRPGDPQGWILGSGDDRPLVILGHQQLLDRLTRLETLLRSQIGDVRTATHIDLRFADRAILRSSSVSG